MFAELADEPKSVALKESSGDPRWIAELHIAAGDRFALFTSVDDLLPEVSILGIDGGVAGSGIAFPREIQQLCNLDPNRPLGRSSRPLSLVPTAPEAGHAPSLRPVHQAVLAGNESGRRMGPRPPVCPSPERNASGCSRSSAMQLGHGQFWPGNEDSYNDTVLLRVNSPPDAIQE